jgi:hypothetical protein
MTTSASLTPTSKYSYHTSPPSDKAKPGHHADEANKQKPPHWDEKLEALRSFRKSKGLCFTCGDKWSHTQKCSAQVPLHVLEELLDVCLMPSK